MEYVASDLKEIAIGALLITILGLVFMLAFTIWLLESEEPSQTFPSVVPKLWSATGL